MKISIITATYNSIKSLPTAVESISAQDYPDIEWVVVDGGSTDGTIDYLLESAKSKYISEKDSGVYDALNKGIAMASGDVIGFLHSDDFFASSTILTEISKCFEDESIDGVYGDLEYVSSTNTDQVLRYWKSADFRKHLLKKGWMPAHPTLFLRRSVYEKHGTFNLKYRIAADYDITLRIFSDDQMRFRYIPKVITKMRVGGISNTPKNIKRKMVEDLNAIRQNKLGFPILVLLSKNLIKVSQFINRKK